MNDVRNCDSAVSASEPERQRQRARRSSIVRLALAAAALTACSRPSAGEPASEMTTLPAAAAGAANAAPTAPPTAAAPEVGFGTVMADVARRFEIFGRASRAGRYELADYELGELGELFDDALPHASPPKEGTSEVLPGLISAFVKQTLPDLQRAVTTHDGAQLTAAFGRAAANCNACHQASGHGFIEVPSAPGHAIPDTDPLPAATR